jgi:hypothetical protein
MSPPISDSKSFNLNPIELNENALQTANPALDGRRAFQTGAFRG